MSDDSELTSLDKLGEFGLIQHLTEAIELQQSSSVLGIGDDAAVLDFNEKQCLVSTDMLVEGVHFDLAYVPLEHLGYKSAMVNFSDIYAMGGKPTQLLVSLAVSNRFTLQALESIYSGIRRACQIHEVDLIGGDTSSSKQGLILSLTAMGEVHANEYVRRSGSRENDLLVVSGDLGGAFMGLQVLEREKAVFIENPNSQPDLTDYTYVVGRLLKPEARKDVIECLSDLNIVPTSMIDISDGLSSEAIHLARASGLGCRIYEEKLPIAEDTFKVCEEFRLNAPTIALNGGEEYELLFTVSPSDYEKIANHMLFTVIGHMTNAKEGYGFITNQGERIALSAQGWNAFLNNSAPE